MSKAIEVALMRYLATKYMIAKQIANYPRLIQIIDKGNAISLIYVCILISQPP